MRALTHALDQKRLHHAYLFTGTRGVGKTTLARIMAKALNCETGITSTPCGECCSCTRSIAGRFVDLIEVDAATNTKVDEMRAAARQRRSTRRRAAASRCYVIDEVHMLSNHAFNAMLKTLEEPPEHVKFILATTDPQKIPVTVLSRCLQFNLKQMPLPHIVDHLERILGKRGCAVRATRAAPPCARRRPVSMRDALSLLDQAIAHGAGKIEDDRRARHARHRRRRTPVMRLLDGLVAQDVQAMLEVADADGCAQPVLRRRHCRNWRRCSTALRWHSLRRQALPTTPNARASRRMPTRSMPSSCNWPTRSRSMARDELSLAPDEYAGFVMALLRLHAFRPERAAALAAPASRGSAPGQGPRARAVSATAAMRPPAAGAAVRHPLRRPPHLPPAPSRCQPGVRPAPPSPPRAVPATCPPARSRATGMRWSTPASERHGAQLAQHCELSEADEARAVACACRRRTSTCSASAQQDKLQSDLQGHFGRLLRVERRDRRSRQCHAGAEAIVPNRRCVRNSAIAALEQDRFVQNVIDLFDATLNESSIKPL